MPPVPTHDAKGKALPAWRIKLLEKEREMKMKQLAEQRAKQAKIDALKAKRESERK